MRLNEEKATRRCYQICSQTGVYYLLSLDIIELLDAYNSRKTITVGHKKMQTARPLTSYKVSYLPLAVVQWTDEGKCSFWQIAIRSCAIALMHIKFSFQLHLFYTFSIFMCLYNVLFCLWIFAYILPLNICYYSKYNVYMHIICTCINKYICMDRQMRMYIRSVFKVSAFCCMHHRSPFNREE